jgi:hypothetical protein
MYKLQKNNRKIGRENKMSLLRSENIRETQAKGSQKSEGKINF